MSQSSREYILSKIKKNKPEQVSLPDVPVFEPYLQSSLAEHFIDTLKFVGGQVIEADSVAVLDTAIKNIYPDAKVVASNTPLTQLSSIDLTLISRAHELENVDLAILKGELAVAENAAVWISTEHLLHRALPFITQHLVLLVEKSTLVWNMHEAYQKISGNYGYGVFISGPSKTADIEQSLVVGAHGSRSLTVVLY